MTEVATKEITVQGVLVTVTTPYTAGHQLTEAEANALNQMRAENIGNNVRKAVAEIVKEAGDEIANLSSEQLQKIQALVAERDATYIFTLASARGGREPTDPLEKECLSLARKYITSKLREAGTTQKAYIEQQGEDAFNSKLEEVAKHPEIIKLAKKNLAARASLVDITL